MHHTRLANPTDIPALLDGITQLAAHHGDPCHATPETLTRDLFGSTAWGHALVVTSGQAVSGYAILLPLAQLQFARRGMDLHHLFVWPEHRGTGMGSALLAAAKTHARTQSCTYLTVGTHPDNEAAQTWYLKQGFDLRPNSPRFAMVL